jgi:hypothetical protein
MAWRVLAVAMLLGLAATAAASGPFETFPDHQALVSPDGRYVLRSEDPPRLPTEITGTVHTLVIEEPATGRKWKLYDYLRRVAVAWAGPDEVIVTDYVAKRAARALVFSLHSAEPVAVVDRSHLAGLLPWQQARHLIRNDHAYLEVVRLEDGALVLRAWGYGPLDPDGFAMSCRYTWEDNRATCRSTR